MWNKNTKRVLMCTPTYIHTTLVETCHRLLQHWIIELNVMWHKSVHKILLEYSGTIDLWVESVNTVHWCIYVQWNLCNATQNLPKYCQSCKDFCDVRFSMQESGKVESQIWRNCLLQCRVQRMRKSLAKWNIWGGWDYLLVEYGECQTWNVTTWWDHSV